jgi:hypothetical protein
MNENSILRFKTNETILTKLSIKAGNNCYEIIWRNKLCIVMVLF